MLQVKKFATATLHMVVVEMLPKPFDGVVRSFLADCNIATFNESTYNLE
jgi:hypothetical protein